MVCVDDEEFQSVDLFSADHNEWAGPPTEDTTLPPTQVTLPAIHTAVYDPNVGVEAIEAMVVADPLCLGEV